MCIQQASTLTVGNFLVRKKASVHIHGKVHHVRVTEEVQFSIKQFLLIVDLRNRAKNTRGVGGIFCTILLSNQGIVTKLQRLVQYY